ncbi:disulfide isomerase-like protein 1-6 [Tanacetum coccineum]|uniref:Disulfide isomerase-like protein 1-6 n=1 Tax=Tanacetum coccineum TaxID=301880 RepID=A0ABQ5B4S3_9ASTR
MHVCHMDSILLSAYAPSMPQLLSLPLSMAHYDSDSHGRRSSLRYSSEPHIRWHFISSIPTQVESTLAMGSAELIPRFVEAATEMREMKSGVLMSKVDAERCPKAASLLGIKGYPTLLLFVNRSSQAYTGGFST